MVYGMTLHDEPVMTEPEPRPDPFPEPQPEPQPEPDPDPEVGETDPF
jgi:hypothetical protein